MAPLKFRLEGEEYLIFDDGSYTSKIRQLPARRWDAKLKAWHVPYVIENYRAMCNIIPGVAEQFPAPSLSGYRVEKVPGKDMLLVKTLAKVEDVQKCKRIPQYRSFSPLYDGWVCRPTRDNLKYLSRAFPNLVWSTEARDMAANAKDNHSDLMQSLAQKHAAKTLERIELEEYEFTGTPYQHQMIGFGLGRYRKNFGYFMEQGTGKTYLVIQEVMDRMQRGEIDALLVLCPNSVKSTWEEELAQHLRDDIDRQVLLWEARTKHKIDWFLNVNTPGQRPLKTLIMNIEALSSDKGEEAAREFVKKHKTFMVVDESTRIKSPSATRAKAAVRVGQRAVVKRILSGVPITQGPLDLFAQFKFLDPQILGFSSYFSFRNRYAILENNRVIAYQNIDELMKLIESHTYRVLKADCLDLPPKVYEKVTVELTPEQRRIYEEMKNEMQTQVLGQTITVQHAIVKVMRMQQIVGGFIPMVDEEGDATGTTKHNRPIPGKNPKLEALLEVIEDLDKDQKVIIWARFTAEIKLIADTLRAGYGEDSVVEFWGGVSNKQRTANRHAFQRDPNGPRFFVGQPAAGGIGITLTSSHMVIYYSNDHSLETRLQSEDRAHRIGQTRTVTYVDIIAKNTGDTRIVGNLRNKKSLADMITGDPTFSWL